MQRFSFLSLGGLCLGLWLSGCTTNAPAADGPVGSGDMAGKPGDMAGKPGGDMAGKPGGDMAGGPPDMSMSTTLAAACQDYAAAYCARLSACSKFLLQREYGDAATCQERLTAGCLLQRAAPGTGFGIQQLDACAGAIAAAACQAFLDPAGIAACNPVPGSLANGKACGDDSQCQSALCQSANGPSSCGTCVKAGAAGDACSNTAPCGFGLYCVGAAPGRKCAPAAGLGQACQGGIVVTPDPPCGVELYCDNGKCAAQLGLGATCHPLEIGGSTVECDLDQGLYCAAAAAAPTCAAYGLAPAGGACGQIGATQVQCAALGTCHNGTCQAAIKDGAMCTPIDGCLPPAACTGGTCALFDPSSC